MSSTGLLVPSGCCVRRALRNLQAWYSDKTREERELPLSPADYKVSPGLAGERWTVISLKDGTTVYSGIGPVEILRRSKASST